VNTVVSGLPLRISVIPARSAPGTAATPISDTFNRVSSRDARSMKNCDNAKSIAGNATSSAIAATTSHQS
jgi:hypothetical protein